jgi:hypothetical protein
MLLGTQTVVFGVRTDPDFAPHREIAAAAGFRAVQSTPLVDHSGTLVGMLSTHYRRPGRPPESDLHAMRVTDNSPGKPLHRRATTEPSIRRPRAGHVLDG